MNEQVANTGAEAAPAAGEPQNQTGTGAPAPPAPENAPDRSEGETRTVPVSVLQSIRDELKTARDQALLYKRQWDLARRPPAPAQDALDGLPDDAPLTAAQARKALAGQAARVEALASRLAFSAANPGCVETIKTHLPSMLRQNPGLMDVIRQSPHPLAAAHAIARMAPDAQKSSAPSVADQMQRILDNAEKPGSASAAPGGAGLSAASRIASMSGSEFAAYKEQVKAGKIKIGG